MRRSRGSGRSRDARALGARQRAVRGRAGAGAGGAGLTQSNQPCAAIELLEKSKTIWDPLLAAEPTNAKRRAGLASVYGALGEAWTRLPEKRSEDCSWYQRRMIVWKGLETQGLLIASFAEDASRAAHGDSRCKAAESPARVDRR
jgi:hypothetical protein